MCRLLGIHASGPLEPFVSGFAEELARRGYSPWSVKFYRVLVRRLSRWLGARGCAVADLTSHRLREFVEECPHGAMVQTLVEYLRCVGALPEEKPVVVKTVVTRVLEDFTSFLTSQRGLAQGTVHWYRYVAQQFVSSCGAGVDEDDLGGLTAGKVTAFMLAESKRRGSGSLSNVGVALRAFLSFVHLRGHTESPLTAAVLPAPGWRDTGEWRALSEQQVSLLLNSCDRQTAAGLRDFAILVLLARLGLRAGEVASLKLDDVDWHNGEITMTGKGNRYDRLPLPTDVGEALADYCLQSRPAGNSRNLFLQVRAPYTGLSNSSISNIVAQACRRTGLPTASAHQLRHGVAAAMRRAGAPLSEIGQVLRHRCLKTTAHYAKADFDSLACVARPWPGGKA